MQTENSTYIHRPIIYIERHYKCTAATLPEPKLGCFGENVQYWTLDSFLQFMVFKFKYIFYAAFQAMK